MGYRIIIFSAFLAVALPAVATAQWADCPGSFATQACNSTCTYGAGGTVDCTGSSGVDLIVLVEVAGEAWAYGYINGTGNKFCCDDAEIGVPGGGGANVYVELGASDDELCLTDSDFAPGANTLCTDWSGSVNDIWPYAVEAYGEAGDDYITTARNAATGYPDKVYGGDDADIIHMFAGDDYAEGGDGGDTIVGGAGDDEIHGDAGDDYLYGEDDDDKISGGSGVDYISCGSGADKAKGGSGDDEILGGDGDDNLCGETGQDEIAGLNDVDCMCGGLGTNNNDGDADTMHGGAGLDTAYYILYQDTVVSANGITGNCYCTCW